MIKCLSVHDLKPLYDAGAVVVIDVREPEEYDQEHIPGVPLIPLSSLQGDDIPPLDNPNKLPIVVHCRSGKRSFDACRLWLGEDPDLDIANLEGGIVAWKNAGYPVVTP